MTDASLGEDCSDARCVAVNSTCVTTSAGSRRCACVNKNVQISPTECSMGPSILSSTKSHVFCTGLSTTSQTLGSILLDELSKFPTVTFSTQASVYPEGILDVRKSAGRIDVSLVREISDTQTFVVVLRAAAGEFSVRQDVTVRVTPSSFNEINLNKTFFGSVTENSPPGTYVANVAVSNYTDYKFANPLANRFFNLNAASGIVSTGVGLDRENNDQAYTEFTIQAYSGDQCSIVTTGQLITNVTDVNDNAPTFSRLSYTGRVNENSIPGTLVGGLVDVAVTDKDSGENGVVNLALTGGGSDYFAVEKANYNQFTIKTSGIQIDREVTPYVVLTLTGTDNPSNPQTGITTLNITVMDINDNTPQFKPGTTDSVFLVEENTGPTTITTLTATDEDEGRNGQVSYSLTEGGFGLFEINESTGAVSTVKQIDRENRKVFNLSIQARDQGSPSLQSVTTITVNIRDVNDEKPTFSQTFYKGNYTENAPCTTSILTVAATDLDEGSNANIRFSTTSSNFTVDPTSGVIRCANPLDYEKMHQHLIVIKAENPGTPSMSNTVTVEINVEDVNDNRPQFDKTTYQSEITTWKWGTNNPVDVFEVTDDDSGTNGQFTFSMRGETDKFFIDGETVGVLRIKAGASQPGASTTYNFDVTATDKGFPPRSVSVPVSVHVKKIEESTVRFSSKDFRFSIVENQVYTTPFGSVKASHDASMSVLYTLILGGDFRIDPTSGELTCSRPKDRETAPSHTMVVSARDVATNASDAAVITVTIDDVNDNEPRFLTIPAQHKFSVPENSMGMFVGRITAEDRDAGENGTITYSIESQTPRTHFSVNPETGRITVSGDLDREMLDSYSLTIKATDNAVVPLTATTQATIVIVDVNDNPPTFTETSYAVTVKEDSAKSKRVMVVTATDADSGCNGAVGYVANTVMVNGTVCPFNVYNTGIVIVSGDLDYETTSTYECIVTAVDKDGCNNVSGRLTGSTTLSVTILDYNDNPPEFQGAPYRANISRDAGINSLVTDIITATDRDGVKDGNGVVKYHILSNTGYFKIDRDTGRIYVATPLDTVNDDTVTLRIKATDLPQTDPVMEAITDITISIITDQPRPFFKKTYTFQVKENEAPDEDRSVSIRAYVRRASEEECNCTYDVIASDASSFYIDSMTGELRQREVIDREETGSRFYVTVKATDRHSLLYRTTDVEVIVKDVNDNLPYFNSTQQKFIVNQSAPAGYVIGSVMSLDPDLNSQPRYATIPRDEPVELLGNGTLIVRASLLNYTDIRMVVSVTEDNFDGSVNNSLQTITQVSIEVRPDDHAPGFVKVLRATAGEFTVQQVVTVRITSSSFTPEDVTVMLVEGTRRDTLIADVRTIGSLAGYSNYVMETTDDTARALFLVTASGQVLCGQDMFMSEFANDDTVAKEYIVSVTATKGGQKATVATFYILLFRSTFTTTIMENWIGNILSYSITSSRFRIDIKADTLPDRLQLAKDLRTIRLVNGIDYEAGIRSIQFKLDLVTTDSTKSTTVDVLIKIEDQNDEPPKFKKAVYDFSLPAGAKRNSVIGVVDVTDGDAIGQTSFHLEGAYKDDFTINKDGIVTSKVDLTRGRFPSTIPLRVKASVGVTYSDEANITVYLISCAINAINLNKEFLGSVSENSLPGTYVANVTVSLYTGYTFANPRALTFFNLDLTSGIVTTVVGLDRENNEQAYTEFNIQAYMDSGDQCSTVTIGQLITNVTDVNDNAPTFSRLSYTGRVKENSIPGTLVDGLVDVAVTDKDIGENGVVNFALTGTGSNYFVVEKSSHNQFTIKTSGIQIDREVTPYLVLTLTGTDNPSNPQTNTTTLNITVMDINDNTPQFKPGTTDSVFLVEENTGPTTITTLTATDEDEGRNGQVSYSLTEGGFGFFEINESTGAVSTVKQIDRENRKVFNLSIQARDQGSPSLQSVTTITVNIRDVNDEMPTFSQTFYKSNYTENAPCTTNILTVAATDLDEGNNANIRFLTTSSNFTVDPTSGAIRCANPLDYEEMHQHLIVIKAENPGTPSMSDTVTVEINVKDVNDNRPRFDKTTYQSEITTWKWGTNKTIDVFKVTDDDSGTNGQFTFSMSRETDTFFIDGETVGVLRIKAGASQPGASTTYNFDVTATDKGYPPQSVSVPVSVHVKKIEENTVQFSSNDFRFSIVENQVYTRPFGSVKASHDASVSVLYTLSYGGDFRIDPTSGELTCSRPQDRETSPSHTMIVRARDVATNDSDMAGITVTIDDVNDNAPRFLTAPVQHKFSVPENSMGMFVGRITAEDRDAGENGTITYSIESQTPRTHFSVNPGTGSITVSGDLDREMFDSYSLTIKATDNAVVPLTATTQATIVIMDVNDNPPTFTETSYAVTVKEDSSMSKQVQSVTAADRDFSCNGAVTYVATTVTVNGTECPFTVLRNTGVVEVSGDLDYETTSTYECIVTAVDNDGCDNASGRLTGSTTLSVTILDYNDNPPVFQGAPYRANISRDAGINSLVTDIITATDRDGVKDGNGVVKYHILSNTGYFKIDRDAGRIYVATPLDTVNDDKVTLRIKATDLPQTDPALEAITDITISIITDQPRPFFKKTYTFQVKDNEAPDEDKSVFIRAYVRRASEEECNCTYDVIASDTSSIYIDSMTGELRQREVIDREETGSRFNVTVKATDRHSLLYRTTYVEVIVKDVNDNLPYFNSTQQKFIVNQSAPVGYVIGSVMSLDPDLNSQPRYTTIPRDEPVELLGNGTLIVRASLLNYPDIRMDVSVTEDNFFQGPVNTLRQTITQVYIDVRQDDYNYHAPVFGQETYESSVLFSATTGAAVPIDDFRATDADGHNVTYSIQTRNDRGNLKIDSQAGTISVQIKFDDTVPRILTLVITATDKNRSPKTGSCTVSITLVGYTETELVAKTEYSRLEQDAGQRQLFLGLFITMAILLGVLSIVSVFAIYKWRTVKRGTQYPNRLETAPGKGGKESGEDGYDSLGANNEEKDYNQLRFRDFSAGVPNPAYVSSGPRPTCTPPAEPHPDQTDDIHLGRAPPPAVSEM